MQENRRLEKLENFSPLCLKNHKKVKFENIIKTLTTCIWCAINS